MAAPASPREPMPARAGLWKRLRAHFSPCYMTNPSNHHPRASSSLPKLRLARDLRPCSLRPQIPASLARALSPSMHSNRGDLSFMYLHAWVRHDQTTLIGYRLVPGKKPPETPGPLLSPMTTDRCPFSDRVEGCRDLEVCLEGSTRGQCWVLARASPC